MREFILLTLTARSDPNFDLNNLPEAGRMDLVCRFVTNCFYTSKEVRKDTVVHVCLNGPSKPPKTITFTGSELKGLEPDERSVARIIMKALKKGYRMESGDEIDLGDGVKISMKSFESIIKQREKLAYLHWEGKDARKEDLTGYTFIIGDYVGLPRVTEKLLDRLNAKRISLGPVELFASHCPVLIHNELDRNNHGNL